MVIDRDERIRTRAYEIWEREGRPRGLEQEHWERAGREIDEESSDLPRPQNKVDGVFPASDEGQAGLGGYGSNEDGGPKEEYDGPEGRPGLGGYGLEEDEASEKRRPEKDRR